MKTDVAAARECILESTSNDYESLATLDGDLLRWSQSEGWQYHENDLFEIVKAMIDDGLLRAFTFSQSDKKWYPASPLQETANSLWFLSAQPVSKGAK